MAGYVFLGALAAFGLLSALWAILGWLLPGGQGYAVVCWGLPDEMMRNRCRWLRSLGLVSWPVLVVTNEFGTYRYHRDLEFCRPENLLSRLEQERTQFDGTGNGDPSGRDQRRGISEL